MRQKYHLPADKNVELISREEKDLIKKQRENEIREKGGKFHSFLNDGKKYSIWIKKGANVKKSIENHIRKININLINR